LVILLSACGGTAPAASAPTSVAPASAAASAKPPASAAAFASAKPAASAAAAASAKPAASAAAKPAEGGAVGPAVSSQPIAAAKPNIKSLSELKGKTLAVGTPASAASITFELMVKSAGLDPKNDIKWVYAGTPAAEWAALDTGQVDGATLVWPFDMLARQKGFN